MLRCATPAATSPASYTLTGYLGAVQAFSQTGTIFGSSSLMFVTVASTQPTLLIDRLVITEANVANTSSANVDNIRVDAATTVTPEPSSLALLGTGVLGVIGAARRRFAA